MKIELDMIFHPNIKDYIAINFLKIIDSVSHLFSDDVVSKIDVIILTDNFANKCRQYGGNSKETVGGCQLIYNNENIILINYNQCNCNLIGDCSLSETANHFLCHEIAHVENLTSQKHIEAQLQKLTNDDFLIDESWFLYNEFLAEFKAQSLIPLHWDYNIYLSDSFCHYVESSLATIYDTMHNLNARPYSLYKSDCQNAHTEIAIFLNNIRYQLTLMAAQCIADNKKFIVDLPIQDSKINHLIQDFINALNNIDFSEHNWKDNLLLYIMNFVLHTVRSYKDDFYRVSGSFIQCVF